MGALGDDKAVPTLKEWAVPGKRIETRQAAIASLARLQKDDKEITQQIASYLPESHAPVRFSAILALGERGDARAIPALESLLKSNDLSIEIAPMIKDQIARLQQGAGKPGAAAEGECGSGSQDLAKRLERLEKMLTDMAE